MPCHISKSNRLGSVRLRYRGEGRRGTPVCAPRVRAALRPHPHSKHSTFGERVGHRRRPLVDRRRRALRRRLVLFGALTSRLVSSIYFCSLLILALVLLISLTPSRERPGPGRTVNRIESVRSNRTELNQQQSDSDLRPHSIRIQVVCS